ncbi:energy transducer TonB [Pontimicrobium sp. IMCC45349]|uniref:energy transducer TonB n=1 Tax=Pontimicrobium sp. IMCC45349 TaxID=3391574 RepID=UPI0039A3783B
MKTFYSISVPEPCHEDWNKMTPKEKGRFCNSCAKTVIDFTKMNTYEIQDFINENKGSRICGHFKKTQLDSINLHVPMQELASKSFHKLFLLALLIAMGTSLMSCTNKQGNTQKIDSVEIIDSISNKVVTLENIEEVCDSTPKTECTSKTTKENIVPPIPQPVGIIVVDEPKKETTKDTIIELQGDVEIKPTAQKYDSIPITVDGELDIEIVGDVITEIDDEYLPLPFALADSPPEFKDTPKNLSTKEKRDYFQKHVNNIVTTNLNIELVKEIGLIGKQKVFAKFTIDKEGFIKDIQTRAPHIKLEEEAKRVIQLISQLIPGKQRNRVVPITYTLPIIFKVED